MSNSNDEELPKSVKARIERNRQRAIILRQSRLVSHPYAKGEVVSVDTTTFKIGATKYKDTGGGFLLEEPAEQDNECENAQANVESAPIFEPDRPKCNKCEKQFANSWLFDNFNFRCCDDCKDEEEHKLITKTEAQTQYLLKDCDLDKREPPLQYIRRKNPHNVRWGEMKLYLQVQVEKRALEVWGTKEAMEEERKNREEKRVLAKAKKYDKQLKELRMSMRSSLYDRTSTSKHTHRFGPELYNEEEDTYSKKCLECPYEETYEKM